MMQNSKPVGLRERKMIETKEKILVAAEEIFLEHGFKDTTIAMISKSANVGYGTVYNYFGNKEGLLICIVNHIMEEFNRMLFIDYAPTSSEEAEKIIYNQVYKVLFLALEHRQILKVFYEAMGIAKNISEHWGSIVEKYIARITNDIGYSKNVGLAKPLNQNIASKAIVYLVVGFFWEIVHESTNNIDEIIKNVVGIYMQGLYYYM